MVDRRLVEIKVPYHEEIKWEECPNTMAETGGEHHSVEGGSITIDGTKAWQNITCTVCGLSWIEVYKASHRFFLIPGDDYA